MQKPFNPFEKIGLTLSGGGFRSACFQLGTISYLEKIGVLKNVIMTSSVSGGSFTHTAYLLSLLESKSDTKKETIKIFFQMDYLQIYKIAIS